LNKPYNAFAALPANFTPVPAEPMIFVGPNRYCLIAAAAAVTGLSAKAIRRKIEDGVWIKDKHYRKAPDGHVYINMEAVNDWIEGKAA
jgi:hypothetical protein